jgi:osmotically-inducible protein OsmY
MSNKSLTNGEVDSWEELQAIERAAWSVPGIQTVQSNVTII